MPSDDKELINILWDEWKYRNTLYWQIFYRFGFIILFVTFVPYVYPSIVSKLETLVIAFPIAGAIMSIFATWLLDAEATRFLAVSQRLNEFRGKYIGERFTDKKGIIWWFRKARVGFGISIMFGVVLVFVSIVSAYVLFKYGVPTSIAA